jgi:AcrR family transcriptional regulator
MEQPQLRRYHMNKRLQDVEKTRRRIVEAAVELHGTIGPRHTTISGVAELASVQRSTLYRHFSSEAELFGACSGHWLALHPLPDPERWRTEHDPGARLLLGLVETYTYYAENERMMANVMRDLDYMPEFIGELVRTHFGAMHAGLLEPWGAAATDGLAFAIAHALDFRAWHSLQGLGMAPEDAARLMHRMVVGTIGALRA